MTTRRGFPLLSLLFLLLALVLAAWPGSEALAQRDRFAGHRVTPVAQSRPLDQAQAALKARQPAKALAITDQALKVRPEDSELRFTRGLALVALDRPEEAEAVFRGLTQDYPELPEPYNNLAFILAARGDLEGARMALVDALRALPDYALGHENLGDIYLRLAARHYQEAAHLAAGANRAIVDSATGKLQRVEDIRTGSQRGTTAPPTSTAPSPTTTLPLPSAPRP